MSDFKAIMKEGWHPKGKDGGKESWRGDFKGINQVAGWMGKGRDPSKERSEHISQPLSSLKDPAAFGPPPKNVNYHGAAAVQDRITPDTRGWGRPLTQEEIQSAQSATRDSEQEAEPSRPAPPPVPYRANTTGLSTDHLPPPPVHRHVTETNSQSTEGAGSKSKPSLPPRLPPRQNSMTSTEPFDAPPAYEQVPSPSPVSLPPTVTPPVTSTSNSGGYLNHGAVNRLGKAGISVPGLGISEQSKPWRGERSQSSTSGMSNSGQLSELQQRFAKMNTGGSSPQSETATSQGTTWAQKQQAMQAAQNFQKDPSSVSAQDAQQAATTANNFRERHGDQIKAASTKASEFNKKHNITGRINSFLEKQSSPSSEQPPQTASGSYVGNQSPEAQALNNRKPPPPPPLKKPANMSSHPSNTTSGSAPPPPVPLGTKPR